MQNDFDVNDQANNVSETNVDEVMSYEAETIEVLANLAKASAEYKSVITTLTNANASLVKELTQLRKESASLKNNITANRKHVHFVWSCGRNAYHTSNDCTKKKEGNKSEDMWWNMISGGNKCCKNAWNAVEFLDSNVNNQGYTDYFLKHYNNSKVNKQLISTAISDSGTSGHYAWINSPYMNTQLANPNELIKN